MAFRDVLLREIAANPIAVRDSLADPAIEQALSNIGILPKVLELHAPSAQSRNSTGLGRTLCGRNGTRHSIVTCKDCRRSLDRTSGTTSRR
jgi:hypothetical protein